MRVKFAPYAELLPAAQVGEVMGRGYRDNIAQVLIAFASPGLFLEDAASAGA